MLDVVVRGGTVVDGTGSPPRRADVGVSDGRVVAVGRVEEPAARTIDASGLVVAPGFVDIHTHYDAQLLWDPFASPSLEHGVTTVVGGNCGFTVAPSSPKDADYLRRMLARVEGMPLEALEAGAAFDWTSFGEFLERLEGRIAPNAGFLAGHSTIRRVVMGEAAVGERATDDQVAAMADELRRAIAAGALGLSSSQSHTHNDADGQPVPSRAASAEELLALAGVVGELPGTTLELILSGCLDGFSDDDVRLMTDLSLAAGRPLNWNLLAVDPRRPAAHEHQLAASTAAAARGARVVALTLPHVMRIWLSFRTGFLLDGLPGWREVFALPVPERMRALSDPEVRRRLAAGASSPEAGILGRVARFERMEIAETFAPQNEGLAGRTVGEVAAERGQDPFDALVDIVLADELRTGLYPPLGGDDDEAWRVRAAVWRDERTVVGGSDAGAHLDMMCGAIYTTHLLGDGVRARGLLPLEEAVRQLTDVPARLYGLRGRGRVAEGFFADLTLFDPERIAPGPIRTRHDLPAGAPRLYADATGIEHVLVNGVEVLAHGRPTGATPGVVLRSGRDTETVAVPGARRG